MPQRFNPKDFLLDPEFHGLDKEIRRRLLNDVWPEFAQGTKEDQDATLDQTMDQWGSLFKPPAQENKSRWQSVKEWIGKSLEPPPQGATRVAPSGPLGPRPTAQSTAAPPVTLEPPPSHATTTMGVTPRAAPEETSKKKSDFIDYFKELADPSRGLVPIVTSPTGGVTMVPRGVAEKVPFTGGIAKGVRYAEIVRAARRVNSGEAKEVDWAILRDFKKEIDEGRETEATWGRSVAEVLTEFPGFAAEIAMTGGAFSLGKKIVTTALEKAAKRSAERFAGKAIAAAGGAAIQTLAMPHRIAATGLETLAEKGAGVAIREAEKRKPKTEREWKEAFSAEIKDHEDDFASSFLQAAPEVYAEILSERTGGALAPLKNLKAVQKIQALKASVINKYLGSPLKGATELFDKIRSATGWHGVIEEMFEERVADVMHYVQQGLGLESDFGKTNPALVKMVTGEGGRAEALKEFMYQLSVEAAAFSVPGAAREVISRAGKRAVEEPPATPKGLPEPPEPPTKRPALGPAPIEELPGGGIRVTGELRPGEEGGLPPHREITITPTGEGGIQPPEQIRKELPFTQEHFEAMRERLQLIKDGHLKLPGINVEKFQRDMQLARQREDFAALRQLRERLGITMPGDEELMARMRILEAPEPEAERLKLGLERTRMMREGRLEPPPEWRRALPEPTVSDAEQTINTDVNAIDSLERMRLTDKRISTQPERETDPEIKPPAENPAGTTRLAPLVERALASETVLESPYPVSGGAVTTPTWTYDKGAALRPRGKTGADQNIWVRQDNTPSNETRTLMVQFSSDLLQTAPPSESGEYYNNLYNKRSGYERPADFWELPQWQAHLAYSLPETDHYTVRDIDEAIEFINQAGYKNVAFSALDVNKGLIRQIAENYNGKIVVGGYTDMGYFSENRNVEVFPSVKDFVESEGGLYREGYDYRLFDGSRTIPRLTMSDGCRHACVFCAVPKKLVESSPNEIMQQADTLARDLPANLVYLNDKTFGQASNHTMLPEVYDRIKLQNPDFEGFIIQTTAAQMKKLTPEFIQRSGIKYIELGIESYNDPILRSHKKLANEKLIQEAADKIRDARAILIPNIMVGLPGETQATYDKTLEWLETNQDIISHVNLYNLALYQETELGRTLEARSTADLDENVTAKSWMEDTAPHEMFNRQVLYFGNTMLNRDPARVRVLTDGFYGQKIQDVEEAPPPSSIKRAGGDIPKTMVISTKPGGMPAFEIPLEELVARQEKILNALGVTSDNPRIKQLDELGIEHSVLQSKGFGTWEGPEPNIHVRFPETVPYEKVLQAVAIMGEGFGQDAVSVSHPNSEIQTYAGLKVTKADGAVFTTAEIDTLAQNTPLSFETDATGQSVLFNDYSRGSKNFVRDTIRAINSLGLSEDNVTSYTGDSHLVERSAGQYREAIGRIRDQARAEGRPDLPERLVREIRTALAAGHPARAAEVAARRASEASAEFDRETLQIAGGADQVGALVDRFGGGAPGAATTGEGAGSGLVSPPRWSELAGAIRGGGIRPSEAVAPSAILGPSISVEDALKTRLPGPNQRLIEGQTPDGLYYGNTLAQGPWTNIGERNVTIFDPGGFYKRDYLRLMLADPAMRAVIDLQGQMFDELKVYMQDAYPGGDFQRAQYVGDNTDWKRLASNGNGDLIFGTGGPCPITTNSLGQLAQVFSLVGAGDIMEEEIPFAYASLMVECLSHEIRHQAYRADDSNFEKLMDRHRWQDRQFIEKIEEKYTDILSANNNKILRDLVPQYYRYVDKTVAIREFDGIFSGAPDTFTRTSVDVLAKSNVTPPAKTGKIVAPTIDEVALINKAKGGLTPVDLERTSAMTDLVSSLLGRAGITSEQKARSAFTEFPSSGQYGSVSAKEFGEVYRAAMIKSARNLTGLLPEEQELLTPMDLVRIYEFSEKLEPMIKDFEALSKMGKITKGWYRRAKETTSWLSYHLPGPPSMTPETKRLIFVKLLAATSPQQGVKDNFLMALRVWRYWADPQKAAEDFPDLELHQDIVPFDTNPEHLKTLVTTSTPDWEITDTGAKRYKYERDHKGKILYDIDSETGEKSPRVIYLKRGLVDILARVNNTITAFTGKGKFDIVRPRPDPSRPRKSKPTKIGEEWRDVGPLDLSGFKVSGFGRNIWGLLQYLAIDTHMANMADVDPHKAGNKAVYLALSNAFRQAASNLGYKPAEQQETSWNPMRTLFLLNRRQGVPFIEGLKAITPDLLREYSANTELATMLLEDEDVKFELETLGIADAVREAHGDLQATTELGRDLSGAEKIDPGIFESIAERSERVAVRRAAARDEELERRGFERPPTQQQLKLFGAAAERPGSTEFEFGEGPPVESLAAAPSLEPPPEYAKKLPKSLSASDLGVPVKDFADFDGGGWIMPDGIAVKFSQFHYTSLAKATGLRQKDVIPRQKELAAKYSLVRIRVTGQPWSPRPGAEIYGMPTDAQMLSLSRMQRDLGVNLVFDITDPIRKQAFVSGSGIGNLRRSVDEHFAPVESKMAAPLPRPPSATPELDKARSVFEKPAKPSGLGIFERAKGVMHELERRWITEFAPIAHMEAGLRERAGLEPAPYMENMAAQMEAVYGATAKGELDVIDLEEQIMQIKDNLKDFDTFLFLRRTEDRISEDPQKRRVGGWTIEEVRAAISQMRTVLGNNMVDEFYRIGDNYVHEGKFVVGPYQRIMDRALRLMVESGRMSQEVYDRIKEMNDFYAPFKVLEYLDPVSDPSGGVGGGRKIATRADLTQAIKGIDDPNFRIDSILAQSAQQIFRARILAEKNKAMLKLSELSELDPAGDTIRLVDGPVFLPPSAPGEDGRWILPSGEGIPKDRAVLPFRKDGKNVALIVPKDVGLAVQGLNNYQAEILKSVLRTVMAPARWGATTFNIAFQARNYLAADMPRLMVMSRYGVQNLGDFFQYFGDFALGTVSAFRGTFGHADYFYKKALELGVLNSTIQKVLTPDVFVKKYGLEPETFKALRGVKRVTIDKFAKFANALEESTKITGVIRALRLENYEKLTGKEKEKAENRIRTELRRYSGSPDFLRGGPDSRATNLLVMFINARLQGTHSDVGRLLGKTGKESAAQAWTRLTIMMLPMLGVALINRSDDELAKDYDQVPSWEKENYFMIPRPSRFINEDGQLVRNYWRIPKREIFKLAGNMIDALVGFMADKDPPSIASVANEFLGNISPINIEGETIAERGESMVGSLNPIFKAPAEYIFNRDTFRHRDVVPRSMRGLPSEMQYKRTTPETYVSLGRITGFSPLRIQQAAAGFSAGLITQMDGVVRGISAVLEGRPLDEIAEGDRGWYTEMPVMKTFVRSPYVSSEAEDKRLADAITANQTDTAIKKRLAEVLYSSVKNAPKKEKAMLVARVRRESKDPLLANTLKQIISEADRGLTFQDRQMMRLGVESGDRAEYIAGALSRLPNEQARQEWIKDLRKKRVITSKVWGQIVRGIKPTRRSTEDAGLEPPPR